MNCQDFKQEKCTFDQSPSAHFTVLISCNALFRECKYGSYKRQCRFVIKKFSGASISPVWQYFGFKQDETDSDPPTCKLCLKKVCAAGGNTSNLRRHLQNNHPVESSKIAKAKPEKRQADTAGAGQSTSQNQQLSIADAFSKLQKYERGGKQWQKLTDSVTKCLAKDMMPIYTVEKS